MNDMKDIQYPVGFDKEISDKEKKEISDAFFLDYFAVQETIDARVKTDASLVHDDTDDDDFPLIMRVSLDKSDFVSDDADDDDFPYDDYPHDGDDNYTADDDDDDNYTADDDDDDDDYPHDSDTIKVISLERLVRLKIEFAHEILNRANQWQGELESSQNSVKLAGETYDYVLRASIYAEEAWADSHKKVAALNFEALLCYARFMRAHEAFKKVGLLSPNSGFVFSETQDADSMLSKALKSYDTAYRLSAVKRIVWRNAAVITADAYQELSLAKERETEASAAYVYWSLKAHDALVALPRAKD